MSIAIHAGVLVSSTKTTRNKRCINFVYKIHTIIITIRLQVEVQIHDGFCSRGKLIHCFSAFIAF